MTCAALAVVFVCAFALPAVFLAVVVPAELVDLKCLMAGSLADPG